MDSSESWQRRLADRLGPIEAVHGLGGGAWRVQLGGPSRRVVVAKTGEGVADEALGLAWIGAVAGAPAVPEVVLLDGDLLVCSFVEQGRRTSAQEERLGRELAVLHGERRPRWGGGSRWIGACRVDAAEHVTGAGFYCHRLLDLAARAGLQVEVGPVAARLEDLVPFDGPRCVHGDLWWGNVLWGADGRPRVIDPSCHAGHPEEDLAMLGLFGAVPERLLAAYREVRPLDEGRAQRVALWQLYPLLVHTVLFGGGYRDQARAVCRRYRGSTGAG